jgi:hypothetical protein
VATVVIKRDSRKRRARTFMSAATTRAPNHVAHVTPCVAKPTLEQELRAVDQMSDQELQDSGWLGEAHVEEYNMPQHIDDCHYV